MAIVDILAAAQGGRFFANAGKTAGVSEAEAKAAISDLAPAIAAKLKDKAANDPDAFDQLLDLLEEGGDSTDLDNVDAMTGSEALSDGGAILEDLYGSRSAAASVLSKIAPSVDGKSLDTLGAISATSVLASLAAANASTLASDASQAQSGGGGLLSIIIAALMKGLMQGARRQLAPKRRRRRSYGYYYGQKRPKRRRTRRPGLDDVFRDILGSSRR